MTLLSLAQLLMVIWLQEVLNASFHMKDLGPLTYFLGLDVHKFKEGLLINKQKDNKDLIFQTPLQNSTLVCQSSPSAQAHLGPIRVFLLLAIVS